MSFIYSRLLISSSSLSEKSGSVSLEGGSEVVPLTHVYIQDLKLSLQFANISTTEKDTCSWLKAHLLKKSIASPDQVGS